MLLDAERIRFVLNSLAVYILYFQCRAHQSGIVEEFRVLAPPGKPHGLNLTTEDTQSFQVHELTKAFALSPFLELQNHILLCLGCHATIPVHLAAGWPYLENQRSWRRSHPGRGETDICVEVALKVIEVSSWKHAKSLGTCIVKIHLVQGLEFGESITVPG